MTALAFAAAIYPPEPLETTRAIARAARVADAPEIARLVNVWSEQGLTIARPLGDILGSIGDFTVAESAEITPDGSRTVVACGALEVVSTTVGEIRSISVDAAAPRIGAGRAVVHRLMLEAAARGLQTVVLLTKTPDFFARCGFDPIDPSALPPCYRDRHLPSRGRSVTGRTAMRAVPPPA